MRALRKPLKQSLTVGWVGFFSVSLYSKRNFARLASLSRLSLSLSLSLSALSLAPNSPSSPLLRNFLWFLGSRFPTFFNTPRFSPAFFFPPSAYQVLLTLFFSTTRTHMACSLYFLIPPPQLPPYTGVVGTNRL